MHPITLLMFLFIYLAGTPLLAAESKMGPVIESYGPTFEVPEGSFDLVPGRQYKVIMDIGKGPENPAELNRSIESAARFLNLEARNVIVPKDISLAIVLHGTGARAALTDQAHSRLFDVSNGSKGLIEALSKAGVDIYICGQTAAYRGFSAPDLLPQVTMAVSAMTVHVRLQQEGYQAILF